MRRRLVQRRGRGTATAQQLFDEAPERTDGRNEGLRKGVVGKPQQQACAQGAKQEARHGATWHSGCAACAGSADSAATPPSSRARVGRLFLPPLPPILTALAHAAVANQHQLEQVVIVALRLREEGARAGRRVEARQPRASRARRREPTREGGRRRARAGAAAPTRHAGAATHHLPARATAVRGRGEDEPSTCARTHTHEGNCGAHAARAHVFARVSVGGTAAKY